MDEFPVLIGGCQMKDIEIKNNNPCAEIEKLTGKEK